MAFKDILNKGLDLIQSGAKAVGDAAKEKKDARQEFEILKTRSDRIGPLKPYEVHNEDAQVGKEQMILSSCISLNVEKARLINKALPIDETVIGVRTGKEAKTQIEYSFVATDKRVWIINKSEYTTIEYGDIKGCEIVNKGLMTQGVKFDDKAFVLDGNENEVKTFLDLVKNEEYRMSIIGHRIAYLSGVVPRRQILNIHMKGLTIADEGVIVLHDGTNNMVVNIKSVIGAQVLINDMVVFSKGRTENSSFMSSPMEARKMAVKIALTTGEFLIETMSQNMMNTSYKREEATYIKNYDFSKSLVMVISSMIEEDKMGKYTNSGTPQLDVFHID